MLWVRKNFVWNEAQNHFRLKSCHRGEFFIKEMFCECIEWCWWSFTHSHCCHRLLLISSSSQIPIKFSCSLFDGVLIWASRTNFSTCSHKFAEKFHLVASQSSDFVSGAIVKVETRKVIKTSSGFIDFAHPLYRLIEFLLVVTQFFCNTLKVGTSHSTQLNDKLLRFWVVHPLPSIDSRN